MKFLYDADSSLSEEYADVGHWSRDGLPYRITSFFERRARQRCDGWIVLTDQWRCEYASEVNPRARIAVIPCCVETARFRFDAEARRQKREALGVGAEKLLVYAGKAGSWYLVEELFDLLAAFLKANKPARLLILSGDPPETFHQIARARGIAGRHYLVRAVPHAEMPAWLSACDAGTALIKMACSKRGSSPDKVGEYLATGLPVIITDRIGDTSALIATESLGVVLGDFASDSYRNVIETLYGLWADTPVLRRRCRNAAEQFLDLQTAGIARYRQMYDSLLEDAKAV
jgi:glycosyltransferase involved in cell wall biosynthesis